MAGGILAYPILLLLRAMKSRQTVSQYAPEGHAKKQGTPTMGGLIIVLAAGLTVLFEALGPHFDGLWHMTTNQRGIFYVPAAFPFMHWNLALLTLFVLFAAIGFVDDYVVPRVFPGKRGLGWKQKIVMEFVAAMVFAFMAFGQDLWAMAVSVFLILLFSNAFNFADGLDGLSGSLLLGLAFGLAGIAYWSRHDEGYTFLAALVGATIPFLVLNAPPAKLFMGDVGSLPIGAVLGAIVSAMMLGQNPGEPNRSMHSFPTLALILWSVVMIIELVPVPLQIASVKLFKRKLFIYTPIHHAFEKVGWPESRVVWLYALSQFVLSAAAIQLARLTFENVTIR